MQEAYRPQQPWLGLTGGEGGEYPSPGWGGGGGVIPVVRSSWLGLGYPPPRGRTGVYPRRDVGSVTRVPPQEGTWDQWLEVLWYPLPPTLWTDKQTCVKTLPPPILRMRSVINHDENLRRRKLNKPWAIMMAWRELMQKKAK